MLNKMLSEIVNKILKEHPKFGYVKVTLHFGKTGLFLGYEFEKLDTKLIKKEDSKNVDKHVN